MYFVVECIVIKVIITLVIKHFKDTFPALYFSISQENTAVRLLGKLFYKLLKNKWIMPATLHKICYLQKKLILMKCKFYIALF